MNAAVSFSPQPHKGTRGERTPGVTKEIKCVLLVLALALIGWMFVTASQHAALKHGVSADDAAFCFSGGGELQLSATNPANGRCATVARMVSKFFIRIQEPDGNEVTMFCKEKMQCIEQVKQYLRNRGYEVH